MSLVLRIEQRFFDKVGHFSHLLCASLSLSFSVFFPFSQSWQRLPKCSRLASDAQSSGQSHRSHHQSPMASKMNARIRDSFSAACRLACPLAAPFPKLVDKPVTFLSGGDCGSVLLVCPDPTLFFSLSWQSLSRHFPPLLQKKYVNSHDRAEGGDFKEKSDTLHFHMWSFWCGPHQATEKGMNLMHDLRLQDEYGAFGYNVWLAIFWLWWTICKFISTSIWAGLFCAWLVLLIWNAPIRRADMGWGEEIGGLVGGEGSSILLFKKCVFRKIHCSSEFLCTVPCTEYPGGHTDVTLVLPLAFRVPGYFFDW